MDALCEYRNRGASAFAGGCRKSRQGEMPTLASGADDGTDEAINHGRSLATSAQR